MKTIINDNDCYVGALYHPPRPMYNVNTFLAHIEKSLEAIQQASSGKAPDIISEGDSNQLDNNDLFGLGQQTVLFAPIHR